MTTDAGGRTPEELAREERDRLAAEIREVNGNLVFALMRADELAEEAAASRAVIEEARERFIAILGHDLRSPLSVIVLGAQSLELAHPSGTGARTVQQILRGARRMDVMIQDLLDFARGHLGGGIPIKRARTDLRQSCDEAVSAVRLTHPNRTIVCEAVGDLTGDWDRDRLEQVFANLLDNAIRHGEDPINVSLSDEGAEVTMAVHTWGSPIAAMDLPGIFKPYHGRPRSRSEGLGLGLYIVSEIVRAHDGSIAVRSSEDEGTTFTMRWPKRGPGGPIDDPAGVTSGG